MSILALTLLFNNISTQLNLPPGLLQSICYIESKYDVNAVHHDDGNSDSLGLCQIKLETAKWLGFKGTKQQLMIPKINVYYAGKYLQRNLKRYNNTEQAVIAYNMGHTNNLTRTNYSYKVIKRWGNERRR